MDLSSFAIFANKFSKLRSMLSSMLSSYKTLKDQDKQTSFKNIKIHKLENVGHGGQQKKSLQSQNTQCMLFIKCKMSTYF